MWQSSKNKLVTLVESLVDCILVLLLVWHIVYLRLHYSFHGAWPIDLSNPHVGEESAETWFWPL